MIGSECGLDDREQVWCQNHYTNCAVDIVVLAPDLPPITGQASHFPEGLSELEQLQFVLVHPHFHMDIFLLLAADSKVLRAFLRSWGLF